MPPTSPFVLPLQLAETMRVCAPTVLEAALGRLERETCDARLATWAKTAIRLAEASIDREGLERVESSRTHLLMSNHQSAYDIFALFYAFPYTMRMVAKKEMFALPIMAGGMRAAEFIEIDRRNHQRARAALDRAKQVMDSGVNVWIAPEGTRSQTGALLPFKKGGFMLALQTGVPILPVTVVGTRDILPAKDFRVRKGQKARIVFHDPIDPSAYGLERREALMADVRDRIASALPVYPPHRG